MTNPFFFHYWLFYRLPKKSYFAFKILLIFRPPPYRMVLQNNPYFLTNRRHNLFALSFSITKRYLIFMHWILRFCLVKTYSSPPPNFICSPIFKIINIKQEIIWKIRSDYFNIFPNFFVPSFTSPFEMWRTDLFYNFFIMCYELL